MPIKIKLIGADALEKVAKLSRENRENLMRDLVTESQRFGLNAVAIAKRDYLRGPRPQKVKSEGLLKSRINTQTERKGDVIETHVGSDVIYARIQELGGTTHPSVTERMRKFMWFMFYKTKDDKFKRMALTKKNRLTVKIPERPYLRPAIKDAMPSFQENIAAMLGKLNFMGAQ